MDNCRFGAPPKENLKNKVSTKIDNIALNDYNNKFTLC